MGYNSWNDLECQPDERKLKIIANKLQDLGLAKLGYEYVVVDDCWMETKLDSDGRLIPRPTAFPSGLNRFSDYLHRKGFKFGIYTDRGEMTCAGKQSSRNHELTHA